MPPTARPHLGGALAVVLALVGCGGDDGAGTADSDAAGEIVVFAAASLSDAFTELGAAFTAATPDAEVTFNFAGSSDLAAQIAEGAPADVFVSADLSNMTKLTDANKHGSEPIVFTTNLAQIVVEAGNPQGIVGVADLAREDLVVIACAPEVPCGRYAQQVLDRAGVAAELDSLEENVRAVVSKVALGEADAGIVYVTDVIAAGDAVEGVDIPTVVNVVAEYPIVVTSESGNPTGARAFVDFVLSAEGQTTLESYGFVSP
jgi:molybdate transport system substrate-binding protein